MSTSREKIDYWDVSKTREKRSTIDWLTDSKSKKIDNWLSVEDSSKKIDTIDLLIEFSSLITMSRLTFRTRRSTIDCHYRWLTIILADSRCVKWKSNTIIALKEKTSSSRRFTIILADSRLFSLTHDAHNEQHSSSAKTELRRLSLSKNFDLTILFCLLAYFDEQSVSQKVWSNNH